MVKRRRGSRQSVSTRGGMFGGLFGQRLTEQRTRESDLERPLAYFRWLWIFRVGVVFLVLIPLPILIGWVAGPLMLTVAWAVKKRQLLRRDTFPRTGITIIEWWVLIAAGVLLTVAAACREFLGWQTWPMDLRWGFDIRIGVPTITTDLKILFFKIQAYRQPISSFWMWLRLVFILGFTIALWLPFVLLDWRFRLEIQDTGQVTFLPADPGSFTESPDGIKYNRPNDIMQELPEIKAPPGVTLEIGEESV